MPTVEAPRLRVPVVALMLRPLGALNVPPAGETDTTVCVPLAHSVTGAGGVAYATTEVVVPTVTVAGAEVDDCPVQVRITRYWVVTVGVPM